MLIDDYDAALFDLDGVVYLGPDAVPGAPEGLAALREHGTHIGFVTNNAARPPQVVVDQLVGLGVQAGIADVVTSAQAGAHMLGDSLPPDSLVYVAGSEALADEVRAVGMRVTRDWRDEPAAVIQGYDPNIAWSTLDGACHAIQRGAQYFVTNSDLTRPTDVGLVPGAGAQIAVVRTSVTAEPTEAGKPCPPLLNETVRRLGASHPIFVGDRLDTDIEGAHNVGMDSLMVFTGAHGKHDVVNAEPNARPTHVGPDLRALLAEPRTVHLDATSATVNNQRAVVADGRIGLDRVPQELDAQFDALWAVLQLAWAHPDADATAALDALDLVR